MPEQHASVLSFLFNMAEAAARADTAPLARNPHAPDTEEHERWWADLLEWQPANANDP
jgi:hypothetical protein